MRRVLAVLVVASSATWGLMPAAVASADSGPANNCESATGGATREWIQTATPSGSVNAGPGVGEGAASAAAAALEGAEATLRSAFGEDLPRDLSICLVRGRSLVSQAGADSAGRFAAAVALPAFKAAIVSVDNTGEIGRLTVHETAHLLAAAKSRRLGERPLPSWLAEGIAEYVALVSTGSADKIDLAASRQLAAGSLPSIRQLESERISELSEVGAIAFYDASASLTAAFVDKYGWNAVWEMLRITGKLPADLESSWHARLGQPDPIAPRVTAAAGATAESADLTQHESQPARRGAKSGAPIAPVAVLFLLTLTLVALALTRRPSARRSTQSEGGPSGGRSGDTPEQRDEVRDEGDSSTVAA